MKLLIFSLALFVATQSHAARINQLSENGFSIVSEDVGNEFFKEIFSKLKAQIFKCKEWEDYQSVDEKGRRCSDISASWSLYLKEGCEQILVGGYPATTNILLLLDPKTCSHIPGFFNFKLYSKEGKNFKITQENPDPDNKVIQFSMLGNSSSSLLNYLLLLGAKKIDGENNEVDFNLNSIGTCKVKLDDANEYFKEIKACTLNLL